MLVITSLGGLEGEVEGEEFKLFFLAAVNYLTHCKWDS